jgi:hypothetical protein
MGDQWVINGRKLACVAQTRHSLIAKENNSTLIAKEDDAPGEGGEPYVGVRIGLVLAYHDRVRDWEEPDLCEEQAE